MEELNKFPRKAKKNARVLRIFGKIERRKISLTAWETTMGDDDDDEI